jgi:hypothetical protein
MKKPLQLELFSDGARAAAVAKRRPKPPPPDDEAGLQKRLDDARQRLRELVIFGLMTWLPEENRKGLTDAEKFVRERVRIHYRVLERFRAKQQPGKKP